jgi:hypothetical protein
MQKRNEHFKPRMLFKGLSQDGVQADFSKNLRAYLFNKGLSNEPIFSRIHFAGLYLNLAYTSGNGK